MPRFADLVSDNPQVDLWLDSRGGNIDLDTVEVDILITAEDPEEDEEELGELLPSLDYRPFATPALAAYVLPVRDWLRTRVRPP